MIRWTTAFLDLPADGVDAAVAFWCAATGSTPSPPRGPGGAFATLVPAAGDAHLRVQRLVAGPARVHLDLHADDVAATATQALRLGATEVARPGHVVLASPGGFPFCVVAHHGEAVRPQPAGEPPALVDQLALDVPGPRFEVEAAFWSALTGWVRHAASAREFEVLERGAGLPLRVLLHRLGPDRDHDVVRAHLDLACGAGVDAVAEAHVARGATVVRRTAHWTTLLDPAGLPYCCTARDPQTGTLTS